MNPKQSVCLALVAFGTCMAARGSVLFSDNFNSYTSGDLIGQGPWTLTGSTTTSPIQVAGGRAVLQTTGQDLNAGFTSSLTNADGTSFYIGLTLNVSSAQSTGDYFLHVSPNVGNSTSFYERLWVRSSGAGFQLGYLETSGTGGTTNFGTGVLNFNTDHRVVLAYNFVAGPVNDTASVYVNPTDSSVEANNTAYLSDTWTTTTAETNVIGTLNLRQGTASSAAGLSVDNLVAGTTFGDVAPIPEPSLMALSLAGLCTLSLAHRLRRRS